jgi:glucosylceramidase
MDVAFRNPDGSTALIVHNQNDEPRAFAVRAGDRQFSYTLPGGALATFTWPRSRALDGSYAAVPLRAATATADPAGETPQAAVDGDASTRWSSGTAQAPGQHLRIDLGRTLRFDRVSVDSGGNLGDYARSWRLEAGADGVTWRTLATGTSAGQLTDIDVPRTRARYLRITSTGSSGSWWSVADVRLYRSS